MAGVAERVTRRWLVISLGIALLACCTACGAAARPVVAGQPVRGAPPDVHGEPLALLPAGPVVWLRVDVRRLRASQHWDLAFPLVVHDAGESLATLERELGFDPLRSADMVALGLYTPPGTRAGDGSHAWPVFYARGAIHSQAIIDAARARARPDDPLIERSVDGVTYMATRERGYLFPADDVVMMFDASLARRVVRQLAGLHAGSAARETRFESLWAQADGRDGTIQFSGDVATLRSIGAPVDEMAAAAGQGSLGASRVEQVVGRADLDAALAVRFVALASSEQAAQRIVSDIDAVRASLMRRWDVRLLGMTRLLMQGITDVHEGRTVRVRVDAQAGEVVRILRVAALGGS